MNRKNRSRSPIHEESKTQKKQGKAHPKFDPNTQQGTPYLKSYIRPDAIDNSRYICILCRDRFNKNFCGFVDNLKGHLDSAQHAKTYDGKPEEEKNCKASIKYLQGVRDADTKDFIHHHSEGLDNKVSKKESDSKSNDNNLLRLEMVEFLVNNNLPFSLGERILKFFQSIIQSYFSKTILEAKIHSKFISSITKKFLGKYLQEQLFQKLEDSPFSISVDGGSDDFGKEYLAISALYYNCDSDNYPKTSLLGLIELGTSYEGDTLYGKLKQFLFERTNGSKLKENFMGICSDHGSNMISDKVPNSVNVKGKGLCNRLKADFPYIFVIHDYCHAFSLIVQEAIEEFPPILLSMIRDICSHFSKSPQAKAKLREIQKIKGKDPLGVVKYVPTRWFSLLECINRILILWEELDIYFTENGTKKQRQYFTKENHLYSRLLSCLLGKVNYYNMFFQSEILTTYEIMRSLKECLTVLAEFVLNLPEAELTNQAQNQRFLMIYGIDFTNIEEYEPYLKTEEELKDSLLREYPVFNELRENFSETFQSNFSQTASKFAIVCLKQMKYWLPYNEAAIFDSDVIYLRTFDIEKWSKLKNRFKNIIKEEDNMQYQDQIKSFRYNFLEIQKDLIHCSHPLELWRKTNNKYPLLYNLSRALMIAPHSTCSLERAFSKITDIKTIKRNKLEIAALESCFN